MITAAGLQEAARPGRVMYALAGLATVLVAIFPLPSSNGSGVAHGVTAGASFIGLALWPVLARNVRAQNPTLRGGVPLLATTLLSLLVLAFFVASTTGAGGVGLLERVAAGAEALWPLVVVATGIGRQRLSTAATT